MPRDTNSTGVKLIECSEEGLGKLLCDIGIHIVTLVVGRLGSIYIESCAGAEIIGIVLSFDVESSYGEELVTNERAIDCDISQEAKI